MKMTASKTQKLLIDRFPKRSTFAWSALAFFILIYDVIAMALNDLDHAERRKYETFSDGCWRGIEHPIVRWPIWLAIAILVKHLAAPNFLRSYDPIGLVGKTVKYIKKKAGYG